MRRRITFFSFIIILVGILISVFFPYTKYVCLVLFGVALGALLLGASKHQWITVFCLLLVFTCIITKGSSKEFTFYSDNASACGTATEVYYINGTTRLVLKDAAILSDGTSITDTNVAVLISGETDVKQGDFISVSGGVRPYSALSNNKGEISYKYYAIADNIGYCLFADSYSINYREQSFTRAIGELSLALRDRIFEQMPREDCASVAVAMVTGDKTFLDTEIKSNFASSGASHLLAVSGLHVGIFLSVLSGLFALVRLNRKLKLFCICCFLFLYCALTGFSPSTVRAAMMASVLSLSSIKGCRYNPFNALCAVACGILLCNPYRLFDISFQLSFGACFGITAFSNTHHRVRNLFLRELLDSASVCLWATVGTLPFVLYYFGSISAVSIIANLLLVPISSLALGILIIGLLLSFVYSGFLIFLKIPYYMILTVLNLTEFFSRGIVFEFSPIGAATVVGLVVLGIFLFRQMPFSYKVKRFVCVLCVIALLLNNVLTTIDRHNNATVNVISTSGSVSCVHVRTKEDFIIGLAKNENDVEAQVDYVNRNVGRVDALIILTQEHLNSLPTAQRLGLTFDSLYVSSSLIVPEYLFMFNPTFIDSSTVLTTENGAFTFDPGGTVFTYNAYRTFVQFDNSAVPDTVFDVAVSDNSNVCADTIISHLSPNENCNNAYFTALNGSIEIKIGNDISITPFHSFSR